MNKNSFKSQITLVPRWRPKWANYILYYNSSWAFRQKFDGIGFDENREESIDRGKEIVLAWHSATLTNLFVHPFEVPTKANVEHIHRYAYISVHKCDLNGKKKEEEKFEHHFISSIWHWLNFFSVNVAYQAVRAQVCVCVCVLLERSW